MRLGTGGRGTGSGIGMESIVHTLISFIPMIPYHIISLPYLCSMRLLNHAKKQNVLALLMSTSSPLSSFLLCFLFHLSFFSFFSVQHFISHLDVPSSLYHSFHFCPLPHPPSSLPSPPHLAMHIHRTFLERECFGIIQEKKGPEADTHPTNRGLAYDHGT